ALAYLLILFSATRLMRYSSEQSGIVLFIGLNHVLMSMMLFFRSNISGLHLFKTDAVLSVLDRLLMGLFCASLLWLPFLKDQFSLFYFLLAQGLGYVLSTAIAFVVVKRQGAHLTLQFDPKLFREILGKSYPFAVLFFLMSLYTRIDSV